MIQKAPANPPSPMNKAQAMAITERIRNGIEAVWNDLLKAYERKAWKALGYQTWEAYVSAEFSMSRQRSYQLLDQGRVIEAVRSATGNLSTTVDISERKARDVKADLPAVTDEIKAKVDAGEDPEKATEETIAYHRAAKAKLKAEKEARRKKRQAQQAEWDRQQQEHAAALPQDVKDHEAAKAEAIAARKTKPVDVDALTAEVEELREANAALEAEIAALKVDNAKWEAMRVQFEQGGFEKVIADKDEEIRVLQTRVEAESRDKSIWAGKAKYWQSEAVKLGWTNGDFTVDIETGEIANA